MKTIIASLFLMISFLSLNAQNQNSNWCFGFNAGIYFDSQNNPTTFTSAVNSRGSCASISDSLGNLLFYVSNDTIAFYHDSACKVYNANNQIMQNGDGLIGLGWYQEFVIVPFPDSLNLYYVFQIGITENFGLYYSKIDMSQNGGLGAVMQKNIQLSNLHANESLSAIKHANGRDWWVFFRHSDTQIPNNDFFVYLIDPTGIHPAWIQNVGPMNYGNDGGTIEFNKLGTQFSFTAIVSQLELFDFNRCTGMITHNFTIEPQSINGPYKNYQWAAFSPSGRYLYMSEFDTISRLYQYDLLAPSITASKILIDSFILPQYCAGKLKLAPDNKIYMSNAYNDGINFNYPYPDITYNMYNMNLSVINQPDSSGLACNFTKYSFYLGGNRTYWGLPNNPDYTLGPVVGSVCDTLASSPPAPEGGAIAVYPNPAKDKLNIATDVLYGKATICIYNLLGEMCFTTVTKNAANTITLNLSTLKQGLYLVQVKTAGKVWSKKFIKE